MILWIIFTNIFWYFSPQPFFNLLFHYFPPRSIPLSGSLDDIVFIALMTKDF